MLRIPSLPVDSGVSVVVGLVMFPVFGWFGSLTAAFAFYVLVLIRSGFRVVRAILWGVLTAWLFAAATLASEPADHVLIAGGAALFYAGALVPAFRRRWFGQLLE